MSTELHLMILWENARHKQNEILNDIQKHLQIIECFDISWSQNETANNFSRFYGEKLPKNSNKELECGCGSFLLITVLDHEPNYTFQETSRGYEYLNANIFSLKEKYRALTNGGHKIHATNNTKETNHDITLLLGINYEDYLSQCPRVWDGEIKHLNRDLSGHNGWTSLEELFYVLNNTLDYVVLRNYESLPEQYNSNEHGDIDILVNDPTNAAILLKAEKVFDIPYRAHYKNVVNNKTVFWDIRYVGDNYYCQKWQEAMLKNKTLFKKSLYIQNDESYFYSLVYHAAIHKSKIAPDYHIKLEKLYRRLNVGNRPDLAYFTQPFDKYFYLLQNYLFDNHYYFTEPIDKSVHFNANLIKLPPQVRKYLHNNYHIENIHPILINSYGGSGYMYFQGEYKSKKVFIKWGGVADSCKNEFKFAQKLFIENNINFIKPILYRFNNNEKFVVFEFVEGTPLSELIKNNSLSDFLKLQVIRQLTDIANSLINTNILHRDIRPENLLVTKNNTLKLIDMQFSVNYSNYRECRTVRKHPKIIEKLGAEYALGKYQWDDIYSISKIADQICPPRKQMPL